MAVEGYSVIACDTTPENEGKILGGFLCEDVANPEPSGVNEFINTSEGDWCRAVISMIGELEEEMIRVYNFPENPTERPKKEWLHLWMAGVLPEARGRGIAKKLFLHAVDIAKKSGFSRGCFAECTGAGSAGIMQKYVKPEPKELYKIEYRSWNPTATGSETESGEEIPKMVSENSVKAVNALPEHGHDAMRLMVVEF